MIKNDDVYLQHILDSTFSIQKYCKGKSATDFYKDELLQSAVIRRLEIIGEAAKFISKQTKDKIKNVEWNQITGMRNKLIHEYFGVDINIIWTTVEKAIPMLQKELQKYLANKH